MFLHVLGQTHRRWCRTLLAKGDFRKREARIAAAGRLRDLGDPGALPCLLRVLGDDEVDFHVKNAVAALGSDAVEPLIAMLGSPDYRTVSSAADLLGRLGDGRALPALCAILRTPLPRRRLYHSHSDFDQERRLQSIDTSIVCALKALGDPSAAEAIHVSLSTHDPEFQRRAVEALGELKSPSSVPVLIGVVRRLGPCDGKAGRRETQWLRRAAAEALSGFEGDEARRAVDAIVETLEACLRGEDADVRKEAAETLSRLRHGRAPELLTGALADRAEAVRLAAAQGIADCYRRVGPDFLATALARADPEARATILKELRYTGDGSAASILMNEIRESRDPDTRRKAFDALVAIGEPESVEHFLTLLDDPDEAIRGFGVAGVRGSSDPRVVEPLLAACRVPELRASALEALANHDGVEPRHEWRAAVAELIARCADPDDDRRLRAVRQLCSAARPAPEVRDALLVALSDTAEFEHVESRSLGPEFSDTMGGGVIGELSESWTSSTADIAQAALWGLVKLYCGTADPQVMEALLSLARSNRSSPDGVSAALESVSGLPFTTRFDKSERQWRKTAPPEQASAAPIPQSRL